AAAIPVAADRAAASRPPRSRRHPPRPLRAAAVPAAAADRYAAAGMAPDPLDESEFVDAFARHGRALWLLAAAWVGRGDAQDLVHETARIAWQQRGQFTRGTDRRASLAQVLRHTGSN